MRHHLLTKKWCSGIDGAVWFNEQKESLQEAKVQGRDYLARNAKQFQFFKILFDHQNVKPHPCSRIPEGSTMVELKFQAFPGEQ